KRGGYLHPVFTPSGKLLTDDYATNHLHHHGIWFSWARVEFEGRQPDFWNMGDAKGRPNLSGLKGAGVAPCTAVFKANIATLTSPCRTIKSRLTKLGG